MSNISPYTFFLYFKKDDFLMQIDEPYRFDAFSHSAERKSGGFSIDVYLFAENTNLEFTNAVYSKTDEYEDIDGTVLFNLTHGLKRIIDSYKEYGPDGEIELQIFFEGIILSKCDFDLEDIDSDLKSYFKCGFIENNVRSKHKINEEDIIINLYADKNLNGDVITPLVPKKVLLLSKPTFASSKWIKTDIPYTGFGAPGNVTNKFPAGAGYEYFNFCKNPIEYGIEDSVSPSPSEWDNEFSDTYDGTMMMIDCKSSKKDVKFIVTSDISFTHIQNGRTGYDNISRLELFLRVSSGPTLGESVVYTLYSQEFEGTTTQSATVPPVIEFELPTILNEGEFVTVFWRYFWDEGTVALSIDYDDIDTYSHVNFNDCTIEAEVVETTINSVIQGSLWIDVLKKSAEIISGLPVDAPRIDEGGEYHHTIVTNGGGVRNISNIPFNAKTKDLFEMGMMVALDYQICEDKILVGEYVDYFGDRLLRSFTTKPDEKFSYNTNRNFRIKTLNYKFENYEQDRAEQRTLDAVHTEEQLLMPNAKPVNSKQINVKQILDAYKIDGLRRLGIDPETKDSSLTDDTDLVMLKVAPLAVDHLETYLGLMNISTVPGGIKIYVTTFRWDKIGLSLTSSFEILSGSNIGTYTITSIGDTILELSPIVPMVNLSESKVIEIQYSLDGVEYISETLENFANVEGVISPETYTNLYYTKSRNLLKFYPYIGTCTMNYLNSNIKVSSLKSNQDLKTRLHTELVDLAEKDDIIVADIAELKRVTDKTFKISLFPENPIDIIDIFTELNVRNIDGSIGGYYSFIDNAGDEIFGYPDKLDYIPRENKIEGIFLEKYILGNGFIDLVDADKANYSQYFASGIYMTIYNADETTFCIEKRFTKIKINGVVYSDLSLFINNLDIYFS